MNMRTSSIFNQLLAGALILFFQNTLAQQTRPKEGSSKVLPVVDSIAFHLYTDSLKKEVYNYINVDGWLKSGRWLPLTAEELTFKADAGRFEGNNLIISQDFTGEKVTVTVSYIKNPKLNCSTTIYIKKNNNPEPLKTKEEVLGEKNRSERMGRRRKGNL